eukprot:3061706-Rhodomonas_salina.1
MRVWYPAGPKSGCLGLATVQVWHHDPRCRGIVLGCKFFVSGGFKAVIQSSQLALQVLYLFSAFSTIGAIGS